MKSHPSPLYFDLDELVLPPTPGHPPQRIRDALENELQRLFAQHGKLPRNRELGRWEHKPLHISPSTTAEAIGQQIAREIYRHAISSPSQ